MFFLLFLANFLSLLCARLFGFMCCYFCLRFVFLMLLKLLFCLCGLVCAVLCAWPRPSGAIATLSFLGHPVRSALCGATAAVWCIRSRRYIDPGPVIAAASRHGAQGTGFGGVNSPPSDARVFIFGVSPRSEASKACGYQLATERRTCIHGSVSRH